MQSIDDSFLTEGGEAKKERCATGLCTNKQRETGLGCEDWG